MKIDERFEQCFHYVCVASEFVAQNQSAITYRASDARTADARDPGSLGATPTLPQLPNALMNIDC